MYHILQGRYVLLNYIDFDGAERNICRICADKLQGQGKSDTLKMVVDRTVYGIYESEEDKEEVEITVIESNGD